jgi:hypothetical protein
VGDLYNIVDPRTGLCYPYVKSIDIELGILEEVVFNGYMDNGRPRPVLKYGRILTHARITSFDVIHKKTGAVLYSVRKG